jgi:hypothetical protein
VRSVRRVQLGSRTLPGVKIGLIAGQHLADRIGVADLDSERKTSSGTGWRSPQRSRQWIRCSSGRCARRRVLIVPGHVTLGGSEVGSGARRDPER